MIGGKQNKRVVQLADLGKPRDDTPDLRVDPTDASVVVHAGDLPCLGAHRVGGMGVEFMLDVGVSPFEVLDGAERLWNVTRVVHVIVRRRWGIGRMRLG